MVFVEVEQWRTEDAKRKVAPLYERWRLFEQIAPYSSRLWTPGLDGVASLHIDDFSAIPFLADISGVEEYQHRSRLRARQGDIYAAVTPPTPGYENYCGRWLGLEPVEMLTARSNEAPLELSRACMSRKAWPRLIEFAQASERLVIQPFMGIEPVWELAESLADESGAEISVLAPPPPVTWVANDKALFGEVVEHVLGSEWLIPGTLARGVAEMASNLAELARQHPRVALKRLRCASAMGNRVYESEMLSRMNEAEIVAEVERFLAKTEWDGDEAVLAVAWESAAHSPSTQLWIPPEGQGQVRLDGVYEQLLRGDEKVFVGSRPSTLPPLVNHAVSVASILVASALQSLGYVGRCSFDFILTGDPQGEFEVKFTECNGRWGGTSTPMALIDRLYPQGRPPYRARDFVHPSFVGVSFEDLLSALGDAVWDHRPRTGTFLFYNTGPLRAFGKLDVIAIGDTQPEADAALEETFSQLLGLS